MFETPLPRLSPGRHPVECDPALEGYTLPPVSSAEASFCHREAVEREEKKVHGGRWEGVGDEDRSQDSYF